MFEFIKKLFGVDNTNVQMQTGKDPETICIKEEKRIEQDNAKTDVNSKEISTNSVMTEAEDINNISDKEKIYNLIIVDESGSMDHLKKVTLSGINETISTLKEAQHELSETQQHYLTIVTFDCRHGEIPPVREIISNEPIDKVTEFRSYNPCGCTPLYDAMGQSLTRLYETIKDDDKAIGSVTVLTDGLENASEEWSAQSLQKLISMLKELGWSFSYMGSAHNVKDVADLLSIDNVMEFSHDLGGASNTWARERSSKKAYLRRMNRMFSERKECNMSFTDEERRFEMRNLAEGYYQNRVTPQHILSLGDNEIFVFGSSIDGKHNIGTAEQAREFGAVDGQISGTQGRTYAIPIYVPSDLLEREIRKFIQYAIEHPDLTFMVTTLDCEFAGHDTALVAKMFVNAVEVENIYLPREFWEILGLKINLI